MSSFLLWGLLAGVGFVLIYSGLSIKAKKPPLLNHALEILISSLSTAGGIRICQYVATGKLMEAFKLAAACNKEVSIPSDDDSIYFLFGGAALIWISLETVGRRLWTTYRSALS